MNELSDYKFRIALLLTIGFIAGSLVTVIGSPRPINDPNAVFTFSDVFSVAVVFGFLMGLTALATWEAK